MATFVGFSTGSGGTTTTVSAPAPAGVALNDQLCIYVACERTTATTFSSTGWTAVTAASGQNCSAQFLYKTATASDVSLSNSAGSYTITASQSCRMAGVFIEGGAGVFDPVPSTSGQLTNAAGTSFSPVNGPTTTNNNDQIIILGIARNAAAPLSAISITGSQTYANGNGTGLTAGQVSTSNASGAQVGVYVGTATKATPGAVANATVNWSQALTDGGGLIITLTQPNSRIRHVGAALGNSTTNGDETTTTFLANVGSGRLAELHPFYGSTIPSSVAAAENSARNVTLAASAGNYRVVIDFNLTHYGINGTYGAGGTPAAGAVTDSGKLDTFIGQCISAGIDVRYCLWHEPYDKFNVYGTQAQNNQDYANSMGYYGAVLRKHGLPVYFDPSNYSANHHWSVTIGNASAPGLGWAACAAGYIDEIYTDWYPNEGNSVSTPAGSGIQGTWNNVQTLADTFGLPLGILELGPAPATNAVNWNDADIQTFLTSVINSLSSRNAAGKPIADIVMWATNDNATQAGMYLSSNWSSGTISKYRTIFDTYDGGVYGGSTGSPPPPSNVTISGDTGTVSVSAIPGTVTTTQINKTVAGATASVSVHAIAGNIVPPFYFSLFSLPRPVVYPLSGYSVTLTHVTNVVNTSWEDLQTVSAQAAIQWDIPAYGTASISQIAWNTNSTVQAVMPFGALGINEPIVHPVSFNLIQPAISWNVDGRTHVASTTKWKLLQRKSKQSRAIKWNIHTPVTTQKAVSFKVLFRIRKPGVSLEYFQRGIDEPVVHPISAQNFLPSPSATWNVLQRLKPKKAVRWNLMKAIKVKKASAFNTLCTHVVKQGASTWMLFKKISPVTHATWNLIDRKFKKGKIYWHDNARTSVSKSIHFRLFNKVTKQRIIQWNLVQRPGPKLETEWNTLARKTKKHKTQWNVLTRIVVRDWQLVINNTGAVSTSIVHPITFYTPAATYIPYRGLSSTVLHPISYNAYAGFGYVPNPGIAWRLGINPAGRVTPQVASAFKVFNKVTASRRCTWNTVGRNDPKRAQAQWEVFNPRSATTIIEWKIGARLQDLIRQTSADRTDFAM